MYIICCHSLCVPLFFSQDYQRVPLLNFSEKYLGESLGSGVTGSHCWLASFFAISMRIGGFDVPQQVTNCEVFCEMSMIGHDVGIWWYLMVFVLCTLYIKTRSSFWHQRGAGNTSRPGIWDRGCQRSHLSSFARAWATHGIGSRMGEAVWICIVVLTQTVPFVHTLPRLWIWCNQPRQEASYFLKYGSMRMKHTSDGQKRCCFCGICWRFCPL